MVSIKQLLATAALLSQGALASPVAVPDASPAAVADAASDDSAHLAKRGEGIHLFNCRPFGGAGVTQTWLSIVAYCANDSECSQLGNSLSAANVCVKGSSTQSEHYHTWEGGAQSCTFSSGVTFSWNIPSNAQSLPNYSSVGSGSNSYRSFAGYKDDHVNGASYSYHSCEKIYYYV